MDDGFDRLMAFLNRSRGFEFSSYKKIGLARRIRRRMQVVDVTTFDDYIDYLEVHPDEYGLLFNSILINVTSFFRDPMTWDLVATEVLPRLLASKETGGLRSLRVWTAGVASGEEAYTLAMLLAETLGVDAYRARVKIYATDINERDLQKARHAVYTAKDVEEVPEPLLHRYFKQTGDGFAFDAELRRSVVFGRHDLLSDSPISKVDLLTCRNTMMYFNAEAQERIIQRFHFSLNDPGFLVLGKAEMLLSHGELFLPVDAKRRVFLKVPARPTLRVGLARTAADIPPVIETTMRDMALATVPVAQILLAPDGSLAYANESARALFGIPFEDTDGDGDVLVSTDGDADPTQALVRAFQPIELRGSIDRATATGQPLVVREVEWPTGDGVPRSFDLQIVPLVDRDGALLGTSVSFSDVTQHRQLKRDFQQVSEERETFHEELQTTNEELQSTVEELETTNEELETMNEELQSTNEELRNSNDQLRSRTNELDGVNTFWRSVLASIDAAVIVIDGELRVLVWNEKATDLWGLRADEVTGKHFLNLDIGLPVDQLRQPIRACFSGEPRRQTVTLDATNRRGKPIRCRVDCTQLHERTSSGRGAILLMHEE